ncbi:MULTISPECIES: acyl-homoserine-lactone synthase [unclassified Ensifer]|uniref:acyl-homoserine-lactone synthase n=1 Tax=unclassified Ensifer TaxID=2633371 RepID=UPI000812F08E|nr:MULTISPECIES: acyl-homoserine-lactone synthase [unclassified Ensifer]OCP24832.1 hypothetical protein BC361_19710 [Ensifer sp. LC54]OCP25829.1 hypothetical protein BC363_18825 [Ensifer sp. LC384]
MSLGFERFVTKSRLHFCDLNRRWICRTPQRRNEEEAGVISITALPGSASDRSDAYLGHMFRLRARVFSERLGWDVTIRNGRERDTFDDLRPTYIIALSGTGRVVACVRLLPASRPMMVTTVFSENLGDNVLTRKHQMVESSRFCVDTAVCERGEGGTPRNHPVHICRHHGVCLVNGYTEIVAATDVVVERILGRAGWPPYLRIRGRRNARRPVADMGHRRKAPN